MSISRVGIGLTFGAASVWLVVWAIGLSAVAPKSVMQPPGHIYRTQSVISEPNSRTADREQLMRYFLQGRPDGRGRLLP
jgi:hypothetical protein